MCQQAAGLQASSLKKEKKGLSKEAARSRVVFREIIRIRKYVRGVLGTTRLLSGIAGEAD